MRKIVFALFTIISISSCTDWKGQVENLTKEREQLMKESSSKDSSINAVLSAINEIDSNMKDIATRQQLVTSDSQTGELQNDAKTRIIENMLALEKLLQENKTKLGELSAKLSKSNIKITQLQKIIDGLNVQLAQKDSEMVGLNSKIAELNISVDNLNSSINSLSKENAARAETIAEKTARLNTGYFIIGTYKELFTKGILLKEGGFLGMGKSEMIKKDFNRTGFTQVDITLFNNLPINQKKCEVMSNHPQDSYKLNQDAKKVFTDLTITDPEKFWSVSKYLIITADK